MCIVPEIKYSWVRVSLHGLSNPTTMVFFFKKNSKPEWLWLKKTWMIWDVEARGWELFQKLRI